jgi:hypothetical protein
MVLTEGEATRTIESTGKDIKIFRDSQGRAILGVVLMDEDGDNLMSLVQEGESASGVKGLLVFGKDSSGNIAPLRLNLATDGLITIDAVHSEVHKGDGFSHTEKHAIANGASFDVLMINPAGNRPHFRSLTIADGAPMDVELFEGTTVSANGSTMGVLNTDRNSANTNNMTLFSGPTITDDGSLIEFNFVVGDRKAGGTAESPVLEWILKEDTNYLLRVTNNSGGASDFAHNLFWYEV